MTRLAKINTPFMTKTAENHNLWAAYTYIAHISCPRSTVEVSDQSDSLRSSVYDLAISLSLQTQFLYLK